MFYCHDVHRWNPRIHRTVDDGGVDSATDTGAWPTWKVFPRGGSGMMRSPLHYYCEACKNERCEDCTDALCECTHEDVDADAR